PRPSPRSPPFPYTTLFRSRDCRTDVVTGMLASNVAMYFIILTTAATLHATGLTTITTAREAAEALRPLAGNAAYWLFTLGIIGRSEEHTSELQSRFDLVCR